MPIQEVTMISATYKPAGAAGRHAEGRGDGLIAFAAVLQAVIGFFNLLDGIAAIANSHIFTSNAVYVVGDLRAWGWVMTIFGAVQLVAAAGVWAGNQLARWFVVAVIGLNAIGQMFFIPAYPFWSLMIITVDIVALWGLCMYGSRETIEAAPNTVARGHAADGTEPLPGRAEPGKGPGMPELRREYLRSPAGPGFPRSGPRVSWRARQGLRPGLPGWTAVTRAACPPF
jgi:hypothetical protein